MDGLLGNVDSQRCYAAHLNAGTNSYIERFHRSLKEEEVWTAEYRTVEEARTSIARWIEERPSWLSQLY
jgi:Integrase core domain